MKYLFVVKGYYPNVNGGSQRSVQMLSEGLVRQGDSVYVLCLDAENEKKVYSHNGVIVISVPIRNIYLPKAGVKKSFLAKTLWHLIDVFNVWAVIEFYFIAKKISPDVVNTNTIEGFSTGLFSVPKLIGAKLVHTLRDYYLICPRSGMYKNNKNCETVCTECKLLTFNNKRMMRNVDLVLGNSDFIIDCHLQHDVFGQEAAFVKQLNIMHSGVIEKNQVKKSGNYVFGAIGRLNKLKGMHIVVNAFKDREDTLLLAGGGDSDFIGELSANLNINSKFLGWCDPIDFYSKIDFLICPSLYHDPLPRVVYEAYSYGVPVIAADSGGTPEMIEEGITGFLYRFDSPDELKNCINNALKMSETDYINMRNNCMEYSKRHAESPVILAYKENISRLFVGH